MKTAFCCNPKCWLHKVLVSEHDQYVDIHSHSPSYESFATFDDPFFKLALTNSGRTRFWRQRMGRVMDGVSMSDWFCESCVSAVDMVVM